MSELKIPCPPSLDPDQSGQLLSYCWEEALGQPWTLTARYVVHGAPPHWIADLEIQIQGLYQQWRGYVHDIQWQRFDNKRNILNITARALPRSCFEVPRFRSIPAALGIPELLKSVFGDSVQWKWPKPIDARLPKHQWLQWDETDWQFIQRICARLDWQIAWLPAPANSWGTLFEELPTWGEPIERPQATRSSNLLNVHPAGLRTTLTSSCVGLCAGLRIAWEPAQDPWIVFRATHSLRMDGSILGTGPVQPAQCEIEMRPDVGANLSQKLNRKYVPHWWGVIPGKSSEPSPLQSNGCYPVELHTPEQQSLSCASVRAAQTFSAPSGGIHWPLLPQTQVLLVPEPDDPDQPIILAVIPTLEHPSPCDDKHPDWMRMKSRSGAEIRLEDQRNGSALHLESTHGLTLRMDDAQKELRLQAGPCALAINLETETMQFSTASGIQINMNHHNGSLCVNMPGGARMEMHESKHFQLQLDDKTRWEMRPGKLLLESSSEIEIRSSSIHLHASQQVQVEGAQTIQLEAAQIKLN